MLPLWEVGRGSRLKALARFQLRTIADNKTTATQNTEMKVHKPDMVKGRNLLFYNKIRMLEEQIEVAGETLSFYEGLAFVLEEASDRNGEELELEELEELEKLVKITNEKLEKLEEQREAQVNFWENIHKSRVLSATVHPRSGLKMRILYQRAFLVRDGGEGTS